MTKFFVMLEVAILNTSSKRMTKVWLLTLVWLVISFIGRTLNLCRYVYCHHFLYMLK